MQIRDFLSDICSHSQDIGCLEKALKGRHIIESMVHSDIDSLELLDIDPIIEKNVILDVLHFKEYSHLGEKVFTDWEIATSRIDIDKELTENDYLTLADKTKKNYNLRNSDQYYMLLEHLLTSQVLRESTHINNDDKNDNNDNNDNNDDDKNDKNDNNDDDNDDNDSMKNRIMTLFDKYADEVRLEWIKEGYYVTCEDDCSLCSEE